MIISSEKTFMEIFKGKDSKYNYYFEMRKTSKIILVTRKVICFLHFSKVVLIKINNMYSVVFNQDL